MPVCPDCKRDVPANQVVCQSCGAALDPRPHIDGDPVVVLHATSQEEATSAQAALEAEGIPAYVAPPGVGVFADESDIEVVVSADLADDAVAILNAPPLSDEEFAAAAAQSGSDE